jgi:hypothetical protein
MNLYSTGLNNQITDVKSIKINKPNLPTLLLYPVAKKTDSITVLCSGDSLDECRTPPIYSTWGQCGTMGIRPSTLYSISFAQKRYPLLAAFLYRGGALEQSCTGFYAHARAGCLCAKPERSAFLSQNGQSAFQVQHFFAIGVVIADEGCSVLTGDGS